MTREVFVDAGAWIGVSDAGDQYHRQAVAVYSDLLRGSRHLVTTNLVIAESYTAIRRASGHLMGMRFLHSLRSTNRVRRLYVDAITEEQAEQILSRYADQNFSYVDAVSFTVMRQREIIEAFAFDHHFVVAGFTLLPPTR